MSTPHHTLQDTDMKSIPLIETAKKIGLTGNAARRAVLNAGFKFHLKNDPARRNQPVLCLTPEEEAEFLKIREENTL